MPHKRNNALARGIFQLDPKSKLYFIQWTDAVGRRRRQKAGTLRMAEDLLLHRQLEALKRKLPGMRNKVGIPMDELIDDAINYAFANNDEIASRDLQGKLERIRADFGKQSADHVQRKDITEWLEKQSKERNWKSSSRNRYQSAFSSIFRVAIENGKLEVNPVTGIKSKQEDNGRIRFLSRDEEKRLMESLPAENSPSVILSLHTGMRLSEQGRALIGDYNEDTGMLLIRQKKNRRDINSRYVPLTPVAVNAYNKLCEGREKGQPLCPDLQTMRVWFPAAVERAGMDDYTWHCNRHTFASRLVMSGVPIAAVSKLMGHANIQMTLRYAHLAPDLAADAITKMMSFYQ